ncbi:MAG: MFS transporter [Alphaproteobacteria bacterium]|nr:MFS transporter [Alphaproteobacteria bacterium]
MFLIAGAVNLQLPLYARYAGEAGLNAGGMSLLLAGYVGALMPSLVLLGGSSDRLGRRPVVLAAMTCSLVATLLVALSPGVAALAVARWFQGFGVALGFGAATAWMTELAGGQRSARLTSLASTAGFGFGALATAAWRSVVPTGVPATYWLWALALVGVFAAVARLPVPPVAAPDAAFVRPPAFPPGSRVPGFAIGVGWGVAGIVVAVLPGVLEPFGGAWSGVVLFVLLLSGVVAQEHARTLSGRRSLAIGALLLPLGTAVLAAGVAFRSVPAVLLGASIAGSSSHGYGYLGGLAQVTGLASPARSVSGYFLAAYIGFGAPAVAMGALVDRVGPSTAFAALAAIVALLSAGTAAMLARSR